MFSPLSLSGVEICPPLPSVRVEQGHSPSSENIIILNESPQQEVEEACQPELQELIQQIRQLARWPESANPEQIALLPSQLNEALQRDPCFRLEQIQVRILQLEEMVRQSQELPNSERLTSVLNQHLLHVQQTANLLHRESFTPVQDSLWPLYERILRLPTLKPDFFGAAVAVLQEKLPNADSSNPLTEELQALLPKLLPPAHYLWGQEPPFDAVLEELEQIKQKSRLLLHRLEKTEGYLKNFYAPLKSIYETYRSFLEEFSKASDRKKAALSIPKAQLSGVGLGFFSLDQAVARALLSRNEKGGPSEKGQFGGTHAVHREAGVFYKPNPEGRFYIGPEMEFAIYAFYQLLGSYGAAPTALAKIRHLFFEKQPQPYGRALQAGYGIDGILLEDMLGMAEVLPFLERSLGVQAGQDAFRWLLGTDWEQEFLQANPHLSPKELSSFPDVRERAQPLLDAFETLLAPLPPDKRGQEFQELPVSNATKHDFYLHLSNHSTERLVGALTMLQRYPDLSQYSGKAGVESTSLTVQLTDLYYYAKKIKQYFPTLSMEELLQELPQLMRRFDPVDFSTHFVVTLLTNPCDHKKDNLMVTFKRDERGGVQTLSLFGIDNDLAFAPADSVRSMVYLLEPMHAPFDNSVAQRLFETTPEGLVLDWLVALEVQNQRYASWQKQGVLTEEDLFEEGEIPGKLDPSLHIPLKVDPTLIPSLYTKAQRLVELLKTNPSFTHWELLEAIEPRLAKAYKKAYQASDTPDKAYAEVPRMLPEREESALASLPKQSIAEAALSFLKMLPLSTFPLKQQVSLIGKALQTFPGSAHNLTLPGDPAHPPSRRDFFLMAVNQGHCALVARLLEEEKRSRLTRDEEESLSLLDAKNEEEQNSLLIACFRLDLEMIRLLIHYGANSQLSDMGGRSALSLCLLRFAEAPVQSAAAIRLLGELAKPLWNSVGGHRGWGPLHHLMEVASKAPEEAEPLFTYLIEKGANPDQVDNRGKSPLDHAIEQGQERWVEQLIRLGAGRTLNTQVARNFFAARPHLNETYLILQNQSLLLRWHLALDTLRASSARSQVTLKGAQLGTISLAPDLINRLLDAKGDICSQIKYGRRNVNKITLADGNELYFKQYPEMPGVEYAIDTLFELLIGHGTSFTDLARLTTQKGQSYPVLISQGIKGDNLYDVLSDPQKVKQLEKLDPLAFSELLLASMLVNFEDAKPDNFILEQLPNGSYRLVGIDNDHAFVLPLAKEKGRTILQVKNILYCLDQMKSPIHPLARERFLSFTPERLLKIWLKRLERQNENYCALFSKEERGALFKETNNNPGVVIPIPFKSRAMVDIYQKFERLQSAMRESAQLTGMELLRLVIPALGIRYQETFEAESTPLNRFSTLFKTQYSLAIAGRYQTLVNSRQMLRSMAIPERSAWDQVSEGGPARALQELEALQREAQATGEDLKRIRDALQAGNTEPFMHLLSNTTKEKVINGLRGSYEGIDFKAMQIKGKPDLKRQETVYSALLSGNYRSLRLSGCAVLDQVNLRELLRRSPQLIKLKLSDCPKIDDGALTSLAAEAGYLLHLHLSDLPKLQELALPHPSLRHLQVERCHGLLQLTVSHTLKTLAVDACWNLTDIKAKLFKASFFGGARLSKEAPDDFVLERLQLRACPKLQPWWSIFDEWLKASPKNEIDFRKVPLNPTFRITDSQLKAFIEGCPGLTNMHLRKGLDYKGWDKQPSQITDSLLKALSEACPELTSLTLPYKSDKITDSGLKALAEGCPKLRVLYLDGCDKITDSGLKTLVEGCPGLTELILSGSTQITDSGLKTLSQGCPGLTWLDLGGCTQITDSGLKALSEGCPGLTSLNLEGSTQITDSGLNALFEGCPGLDWLDLKDCTQVTDSGIKMLSDWCHELTGLKLEGCTQITDNGLKALSEGCHELTVLHLKHCTQVTDSGLKALSAGCPGLTWLNLSGCDKITGNGLKGFAKLTGLYLCDCRQITDSELKALSEGGPRLAHLFLDGCDKITKVGIKALRKRHPGIKITKMGSSAFGYFLGTWIDDEGVVASAFDGIGRKMLHAVMKGSSDVKS